MKVFLAGNNGRRGILAQVLFKENASRGGEVNDIKISLSGTGLWKYAAEGTDLFTLKGAKQLYILESFAYIKTDDLLIPLIPYFKDFMLDSGAFTFLSQKKHGDFNSYLKSYKARHGRNAGPCHPDAGGSLGRGTVYQSGFGKNVWQDVPLY